MKQFLLKEGAILILDFICLSNLTMLLLGNKFEALWTIVFIILLHVIYFIFVKKYGSVFYKE